MKKACVLALLFGSLLFVGFSIAGEKNAPAENSIEPTVAAPDLSSPEEEIPEASLSESAGMEVTSDFLFEDPQINFCLPEDPEYCESSADCMPGCICRGNCCGV